MFDHQTIQIDFGDAKIITQEEVKRVTTRLSTSGSFSKMLRDVDVRDENKQKNNRTSFVGTAFYVAPEMLEFNMSGLYTDLWAVGCIIFQLINGNSPFEANTQYEVFRNILERKIHYPSSMDRNAVDLINKLLDYDPESRLGYENISMIRQHPYFDNVDFDRISHRRLAVPNIEVIIQAQSSDLITDDSDDSKQLRLA